MQESDVTLRSGKKLKKEQQFLRLTVVTESGDNFHVHISRSSTVGDLKKQVNQFKLSLDGEVTTPLSMRQLSIKPANGEDIKRTTLLQGQQC